MSLKTFLTMFALLWLALIMPTLASMLQVGAQPVVTVEPAPTTTSPPLLIATSPPTIMERLGAFVRAIVNALPAEILGILTCICTALVLLGLWVLGNLGRILALLQVREAPTLWMHR